MPRDYPFLSHARKCGAFSLLELLVVIGIIAILISILVPTLNKTREAATTLKCQAQLRQMGQAIYAYANTNHGLTPAWSSTHNWPVDPPYFAGGKDPNGPGWPVLLMPYTGVNPISPLYTCPAAPLDIAQDHRMTYFIEAKWLAVQTDSVDPTHTSIQLGNIKRSSEFLLIGECTTGRFFPTPFGASSGGPDDFDKDDAIIQCLYFFGEPGGLNMHRAGNNCLFSDSHVAPLRAYDPQRLTYHPVKFQNWNEVTAE
jgi:prepilin-type N-terminal cleavage/methylation domain-containing protein